MKISLKSFPNQTFPVLAQNVSSGDIDFIFDAGGFQNRPLLYTETI